MKYCNMDGGCMFCDRLFCDGKEGEHMNKWINVNDCMPVELPSLWKPYYGTKKWMDAMWLKESDTVLVTVVFPDGTRHVTVGKTQDGVWQTHISKTLNPVVSHWMQMPEPPGQE